MILQPPANGLPLLFGVLNITPDSFSDGGRWLEPQAAIAHGLQLARDGADLIDIGPEPSSWHRPGVHPVDPAEQIRRSIPVIHALAVRGLRVSIDTRSSEVAQAALDAGAVAINDISAGEHDPAMLALAARAGCPIVLMHRRDEPPGSTPVYTCVESEVLAYLLARREAARSAGIADACLWLDPGLGFGKTAAHNAGLLAALPRFCHEHPRWLIGASRKRFTAALAGAPDAPPDQRLPGSLAAALWAAHHGAAALRVHDVAPTLAALRLWSAVERGVHEPTHRS